MRHAGILFLIVALVIFFQPCSSVAQNWTSKSPIQHEPIFKSSTPKDVAKVKKSSKTWIWWVVGAVVLIGGGAAVALSGGGGGGGSSNSGDSQAGDGFEITW
ncbi:MAG: hypothetical protein HQK76_05055 [Desulfobacterales bacterium]|nr:hypothetical protein [Desulfobacterales bacterium]